MGLARCYFIATPLNSHQSVNTIGSKLISAISNQSSPVCAHRGGESGPFDSCSHLALRCTVRVMPPSPAPNLFRVTKLFSPLPGRYGGGPLGTVAISSGERLMRGRATEYSSVACCYCFGLRVSKALCQWLCMARLPVDRLTATVMGR